MDEVFNQADMSAPVTICETAAALQCNSTTFLTPNVCAVYWINPFQFSQRAFLINEFTDPRWSETPGPDGDGLGTYLLRTKGLPNVYW